MYHSLFVTSYVKWEVEVLVKCLSYSSHVPMAQNAQATGKKFILNPIAFHVLVL
jgi:hypothetical protein